MFHSGVDDGALVYIYGKIKIMVLVHLLPHYFLYHRGTEFNSVSTCQRWKGLRLFHANSHFKDEEPEAQGG